MARESKKTAANKGMEQSAKRSAKRTAKKAAKKGTAKGMKKAAKRRPSRALLDRAEIVAARMEERYPGDRGYLAFESPFQLVIAVLLSAQTTDRAVNKVTPALFAKWPTPQALASADVGEVAEVVHPLGFYKTKAQRAVDCARTLLSEFDGEVPRSLDELQKLPGVGRKTANVVLNDAFHVADGIAVDTHVGRVARRLGFSRSEDPSAVEQDLLAIFPRSEWAFVNRRWIAFGRETCDARRPRCGECFLEDICPTHAKPKRHSKMQPTAKSQAQSKANPKADRKAVPEKSRQAEKAGRS